MKFKSIPNSKFPVIPNFLMDDLSSDQYHAYRICSAVLLGSVDANLEFLKVGVKPGVGKLFVWRATFEKNVAAEGRTLSLQSRKVYSLCK